MLPAKTLGHGYYRDFSGDFRGEGMFHLRRRQVLWTVLLFAVYLPVPFIVGSEALRPSWLVQPVAAIPLSAWFESLLMVGFVAVAWLFSRAVFTGARD